jgi:hypothetical protein
MQQCRKPYQRLPVVPGIGQTHEIGAGKQVGRKGPTDEQKLGVVARKRVPSGAASHEAESEIRKPLEKSRQYDQ